jgi:hypothetical protein
VDVTDAGVAVRKGVVAGTVVYASL